MKSLRIIPGVLLLLFAFNSHAATVQTPIPCTWTTTYIYNPGGSYGGADIGSVCTSTTLGQIATQLRHIGPNPSCSLSTSYKYNGTCESPSFYQEVQACSANSGSVYGTINTENQPFPSNSQLNAYCGSSCGYSVIVLGHSNTGATLKIVCK